MNGLVICGGESSRMGTDKSMLNYHGLPQRYYIYNLLKPFCEEVYISCNKEQEKTIEAGYNYLVDEYENIGPVAALLRAFKEHETSWFIIGCDYPFLCESDLSLLIENRDRNCIASSYYNDELNFLEPLICIYETGCKSLLENEYQNGNYSLMHFLEEQKTHRVSPKNSHVIQNVNTKVEYEQAKVWLVGTPTKDPKKQ